MPSAAHEMTTERSTPLRHSVFWQVLAVLMLISVAWGSLTPRLLQLDIGVLSWDKAQHAIIYGWLMWWCAQAFQQCRPLLWAAFLLAMGLLLELLQGQTGYRQMEFADLIANGVGILGGFLLWLTPLGRSLRVFELWFSRARSLGGV